MTTTDDEIESVGPDRFAHVEALLKANDLPSHDIHDEEVTIFESRIEDRLVGIGGLELYDSVGLLRSLVIKQSYRGKGHGNRLIKALEEVAKNDEVEILFLLTISASEYFCDLGYREITRSEIPPTIRKTAEFSDLCPESAICMRKQI